MKYNIWTSVPDYEDWRADLEEQYPSPEFTEEDRIEIMYELNNEYLSDEMENLNLELGNNIVIVADINLWNGKRKGYKIIGTNLNSIFDTRCGDYQEWYVEDGEVKCNDIHHDGTNYYVYRKLKNNTDRFEFEEYTYDHPIDEAVRKYTEPLGKYVEKIYGFTEGVKK